MRKFGLVFQTTYPKKLLCATMSIYRRPQYQYQRLLKRVFERLLRRLNEAMEWNGTEWIPF